MNKYNSYLTIGIDIGSSGIRMLLLNKNGEIKSSVLLLYSDLKEIIWDLKYRMDTNALIRVIESHILNFIEGNEDLQLNTLSFSSIGPSLILLNKRGSPITFAYTYAYREAHEYLKLLSDIDFQKRTGCLQSGALPIVQLLKLKDEGLLDSCFKITTMNDYLTWKFTDLGVNQIFATLPNASYTGIYSLIQKSWDFELLDNFNIPHSILPEIIPLGSFYSLKRNYRELNNFFKETLVVAGTLDGLDSFWATNTFEENIIVGSASTTGAIRRWRKSPKTEFNSHLIQCCQIDENNWIELVPFNNVGTSLIWLIKNFSNYFSDYIFEKNSLNMERLEKESLERIDNYKARNYIKIIPLFFPYIEGEFRGPQGRGRIKGGFILDKENIIDPVNLYIGVIIGMVNLFKHNLDVLGISSPIIEIRLTGLIAHKSQLFLQLLSTLTKTNVITMKQEQSVAWATGMRALVYIDKIPHIPNLDTNSPIKPKIELFSTLMDIHHQYLEVYHNYEDYSMVFCEDNLLNGEKYV
ncbi:MAG: FGGY family carbohydrate kinase [Candidatus Hodarchaeales archaeon]|jgi:sugar (pentulose or hexulose) kinase